MSLIIFPLDVWRIILAYCDTYIALLDVCKAMRRLVYGLDGVRLEILVREVVLRYSRKIRFIDRSETATKHYVRINGSARAIYGSLSTKDLYVGGKCLVRDCHSISSILRHIASTKAKGGNLHKTCMVIIALFSIILNSKNAPPNVKWAIGRAGLKYMTYIIGTNVASHIMEELLKHERLEDIVFCMAVGKQECCYSPKLSSQNFNIDPTRMPTTFRDLLAAKYGDRHIIKLCKLKQYSFVIDGIEYVFGYNGRCVTKDTMEDVSALIRRLHDEGKTTSQQMVPEITQCENEISIRCRQELLGRLKLAPILDWSSFMELYIILVASVSKIREIRVLEPKHASHSKYNIASIFETEQHIDESIDEQVYVYIPCEATDNYNEYQWHEGGTAINGMCYPKFIDPDVYKTSIDDEDEEEKPEKDEKGYH